MNLDCKLWVFESISLVALVVSDSVLMVHVVFALRLSIVVGECFSIVLVMQFFGSDGSLVFMGLVGLL